MPFFFPIVAKDGARRWKMEMNNGKLIRLQNGAKETENMADMKWKWSRVSKY